jgi:hypothetical protein
MASWNHDCIAVESGPDHVIKLIGQVRWLIASQQMLLTRILLHREGVTANLDDDSITGSTCLFLSGHGSIQKAWRLLIKDRSQQNCRFGCNIFTANLLHQL